MATLKEVSERSGLAVQTVSNVLNGARAHLHRPQTCERVLRAAKELNYRPNASARAIRKGCFDSVALVLGANIHSSSFHRLVLHGILDALDKHNLHLTVARLPDEQLTNKGYVPKILRECMADGLLINYNDSIPPRMIDLINDHAIPSIWMRSKQEHDCIHFNDKEACFRATNHLLKLGHARIAYAHYGRGRNPPLNVHYSILDIEAGYTDAMSKAGLKPQVIQDDNRVPQLLRPSHFEHLLSSPDRPTAIICYSESTMTPLIHAATVLTMKIPEQLSVINFCTEQYDYQGLAVTTMLFPERDFGGQAVEMLVQKIREPEQPLPPRVLKLGFHEGATCAAPSSTGSQGLQATKPKKRYHNDSTNS